MVRIGVCTIVGVRFDGRDARGSIGFYVGPGATTETMNGTLRHQGKLPDTHFQEALYRQVSSIGGISMRFTVICRAHFDCSLLPSIFVPQNEPREVRRKVVHSAETAKQGVL